MNATPKIINSKHVSMKEKSLRTAADKLAELMPREDSWEYLEAVELAQRFTTKELAVLAGEFTRALNYRMEKED